ncbi:unnamed protein product [Schistosoma haematobium]|nr:unnamed protein product [Schistosoma haematobium]
MKDGSTVIFKSRYTVIKKLGKGASGKTYLVEDFQESQNCTKVLKALKCIKLDDNSEAVQKDYEKEAHLLSSLKHPYILCIHESFVDKNRFCIVSEYCEGGDLTNYLKQVKSKGERISEKIIGKWLVQIILATVYIHKNKILHRDLKTSNIFLKNGNIKVGDFGISRSLATTEELATTFIGTPYYMSPEVLKYEGYNNKSDIWSIGIILYELCTQRRAFTGTNLMRVMWQVINDPCPQLPEIYSKELQEVLELMLKKTPQERPSASELLHSNAVHSYLRDLYKEIIIHMRNELSGENRKDGSEFNLDLAEQLTHTRNSLNSTMETQLFTWQKGYPSLNHIWPTIQIPTEKLLNELKNLYLEKINNETSLIDELDDDLENEGDLFWSKKSDLNDNKKLPGKGPGAEDESLGTFNFLNSTKHRNEEIEDLTNNMSFTEIKNFYPSPRLTSPIYDYVTMDEFKKQVDIDNNPNINKKGNNNQEALFIRRQFTFPAMLNQNYAQSARQLSDINSSKLKCNSVFTDDTQLMETYYTNYDNELLNYTNNFNKEDLKELIENENILQNDLEDIENQDNVDSNETLNDVLVCMKAALCHPEDSNTIVLDDEAKTIFSPEAKAKRIDALKKYCIDKLGEKEFHNAYHYLYEKRILEKNQSGELTILNGLKSYCSDVTTGFLLDHLLFLENDAVKQTINIQLSESVHQILNDDLSFYAQFASLMDYLKEI